MTGVYSFRAGPSYRGASPEEQFISAMEQPMSLGSTLWDQAKGGVLESFGLGTAVRDFSTPQGNPEERSTLEKVARQFNWFTNTYDLARNLKAKTEPESPALNEDAYKNSAYFREGVKWDPSMTEDRAAALAIMYDAKRVREFYAQKRPITAFFGNLAGQAVDPINYIPVAGPAVRAGAIARSGRIAGEALTASIDAAANTAIFGLATADARAQYGDDVTWQTTVSQIAMAALIGSAFGTIGGAINARGSAQAVADVESRLATLQATQEARVALNESIGAISQGEDINMSPTVAAAVERQIDEIIAYHGTPHDFDAFDINRIGTGEGAQAYGHGLYFAESENVARKYRDQLSQLNQSAVGRELAKSGEDVEVAIANVQRRIDDLNAMPDKGGDPARWARQMAIQEQKLTDIQKFKKTGEQSSGSLFEVGLRAKREDFLDWDKPINEQPEKIKEFWAQNGPDEGSLFAVDNPTGRDAYQYLTNMGKRDALREAGIPGIQYLDAGSRGTGEGTRNYVVFDDSLVNIRKRNGVDVSPAKPDTPPEGRTEAEARIAKPENYKALAEQYKVDPETGSFVEESDIAQLETEGRLTEEDLAVLADSQMAYEDGSAYGEALKAAVGCLI